MNLTDIEACRAAIAALDGQRATLGDAVLEPDRHVPITLA